MKKVLIISGSLPPIKCGVGDYTAKLTQKMAAKKVDFALLSSRGVKSDLAVRLYTVPSWKIRSLKNIIAQIDSMGAGIVHIQYPAVGYHRQLGINLLPYALRLLRPKLKIIITLHEYSQSRWLGRWRSLLTIAPAHKLLVSNQSDHRALKRFAHKLELVPIGPNIERVSPQPAVFKKILAAHKLGPAKPTIIFFGFAFPAKKLEVLLDAMNEPALLNYQLLIFPSLNPADHYHRRLLAQISHLNQSQPRVAINRFLDSDQASAVLQEGRYFVLPAGRPLTAKSGSAIAAVLNGLVLIGTKAEPAADSQPFRHLDNCYLLASASASNIASAIAELDADPKKIAAIRRGAKELENYFSWDHIVKEHTRIYGDF